MNLDVRMKLYEETFRYKLPVRMPVVIRLDGKCFHSLTRDCNKPFDHGLWFSLATATQKLMDEVPARFAFQQSDEVSLLMVDYNKYDSQQWFDGIVQKMASVSASIMGVHFSKTFGKDGYFDSRVFAVPERDIKNYFVWRQQDAMRNAVSMVANCHFSHRELHEKDTNEKLGMLKDKGVYFDSFDGRYRFGTIITKAEDYAAPIFTKEPTFLDKFLTVEDE